MQAAHDDLVNGATNIQKTIIDLQTDIESMNNAIDNNRAAIEKLNKDLVYAQVAVGVGIFMLVAGVALTVATAGTAAAVSGGIAAVGAASIIAGGVTWAYYKIKLMMTTTASRKNKSKKLKINNRLSLYRAFQCQ